jgi:hypothetical protein
VCLFCVSVMIVVVLYIYTTTVFAPGATACISLIRDQLCNVILVTLANNSSV